MAPATLAATRGCLAKPPSNPSPTAVLFAAGSLEVLERCSRSHLTWRQPSVSCKANFRPHNISLRTTGFWKDSWELRSSTYAGKHLPAAASPCMGLEQANSMYLKFKHRRSLNTPRAAAYNDVFKFRYPVMKKKTDWLRRTVACVLYLIALQILDAGYFIQTLSEQYEVFENLMYFVPEIKRLPPSFSMIYCYFSYVGIVKNED